MPLLVLDLEGRSAGSHVALSRAYLEAAAAGLEGETVRIARVRPGVAFGPRDRSAERYETAALAALDAGFEPVARLEGGRAVAAHEQTLHLAWTVPEAEARGRLHERFEALSALVVEVLRASGVDARPGIVPGEYCPGRYSVNARGVVKLAGFGQRIVKGAAHVGGMLVLAGAPRLRAVLGPVHEALDLPWEPSALGSAEEEGVSMPLEAWAERVAGACEEGLGARRSSLSAAALERAAALEPPSRVPVPARRGSEGPP